MDLRTTNFSIVTSTNSTNSITQKQLTVPSFSLSGADVPLYPVGSLICNTDDDRLYISNGSVWNLVGNLAPSPTPISGVTTLDGNGHSLINNPTVDANTRFVLCFQSNNPVIPTGTLFIGFRNIGTGFQISSSAGSGDALTNVYYQLWQS